MAMSMAHRNILQTKRIEILNNLNLDVLFMSYFRQNKILTAEMYAEIMEPAIYTNRERIAKLLDRLPSRGSMAFGCLIEALVETNHNHLAKLLDPSNILIPSDEVDYAVGGAGDKRAFVLDRTTLDFLIRMIEMNAELSVCGATKNEKIQERSRGNYILKENKHCKALILAVGDAEVPGLRADVKTLRTLVLGLGFQLDVQPGAHFVKDSEILEKLEAFAKRIQQTDEACMVFVLRCPPDIVREKVKKIFQTDSCPALTRKPKLIFIQRKDTVLATSTQCMDEGDGAANIKITQGQQATQNNQTDGVQTDSSPDGSGSGASYGVHRMSDMFTTTLYDKFSDNGKSPVLTCMAYTVAYLARYFSISQLITMVNLVSEKFRDKGVTTAAAQQDSTLSTFYFPLKSD